MDDETKYSESEYIAEYGRCGYVLYQCNQIVLQHSTHIRQMSDIIVCMLTVIIQHSTSNAGHSAGVD